MRFKHTSTLLGILMDCELAFVHQNKQMGAQTKLNTHRLYNLLQLEGSFSTSTNEYLWTYHFLGDGSFHQRLIQSQEVNPSSTKGFTKKGGRSALLCTQLVDIWTMAEEIISAVISRLQAHEDPLIQTIFWNNKMGVMPPDAGRWTRVKLSLQTAGGLMFPSRIWRDNVTLQTAEERRHPL